MTTLAIVGAGPGLGMAVVRRFGAEGFSVGLLSRSQERADGLAAQLAGEGVPARGFAADVRDPAGLARTLERVTEALRPIEVLQYSPPPQRDEQGIHVAQLVIGGSIPEPGQVAVAGDEDKDPPKLAEILWDLHRTRDRFRVEVAT